MTLVEDVVQRVFTRLWADYRGRVPHVARIEDALRSQGELWSEDHVALRTIPGNHCGAHVLENLFLSMGYIRRDTYTFKDKKLNAFWLEPPHAPGTHSSKVAPKVFVSELDASQFDTQFNQICKKYTDTVVTSSAEKISELGKKMRSGDTHAALELENEVVSYLTNGPSWQRPSFADYSALRQHSEYAAWTLVFGHRPNHFTVSAHLMKQIASLHELNQFITHKLSVPMNNAGGSLIKGSRNVCLEQSATLASRVPVAFQEGERVLPYAFVEFAYRHTLPGKSNDGIWESYYQGFITENADRIFESTDVR